jgi:two-component system phosphate regulon response regulator OmpR
MSASPKRLLVVDDDPKLRDLLHRYLTGQQFEVALAADGPAMNRLLQREPWDMIILDLMMPGEDGLSIIRRLRGANDRTPVIMLTAKGDDIDRIVGLEMGADDYLPKPFNPRELLARINAVLRRQPPPDAPGAPATDLGEVRFGPFVFDAAMRTLTRDGLPVPLTSGHVEAVRENAEAPGVKVLAKPYGLEDLATAIRNALHEIPAGVR